MFTNVSATCEPFYPKVEKNQLSYQY